MPSNRSNFRSGGQLNELRSRQEDRHNSVLKTPRSKKTEYLLERTSLLNGGKDPYEGVPIKQIENPLVRRAVFLDRVKNDLRKVPALRSLELVPKPGSSGYWATVGGKSTSVGVSTSGTEYLDQRIVYSSSSSSSLTYHSHYYTGRPPFSQGLSSKKHGEIKREHLFICDSKSTEGYAGWLSERLRTFCILENELQCE